MAKLRLNAFSRQRLRNLAKDLVKPDPKIMKQFEEQAVKCAGIAREVLLEKFNQRDMKVLQKYDSATEDRCIAFKSFHSTGLVVKFEFPSAIAAPLIPIIKKTSYGTAFEVMPEHFREFVAWKDLRNEAEKSAAQKLKIYEDVINHCKTFEDLLEIWPEAEQLRTILGAVTGNLPSSITNEMIAAIKRDVASRKEQNVDGEQAPENGGGEEPGPSTEGS